MPLLPLQILYLNMIGDVFPALALGVGRGNPAQMRRPPRDPREPILTRRHWYIISAYGVLIAAVVLGTFALALGWLGKLYLDLGQGRMDSKLAVTIRFLTLAFSRLWHVFNMRDTQTGWQRYDITRNPFIWSALALCTLLPLLAVYIPELAAVLRLVDPGRTGWFLIISASLIPLLIGQISKTISRGLGS